jgi:bacillolysin
VRFIWRALLAALLVAGALSAPQPAASAGAVRAVTPPPPAGLLDQLQAETGGSVRAARHRATGAATLVATEPGRPWRPLRPLGQPLTPETTARRFLEAYGALFGLDNPAGEARLVRDKAVAGGRNYLRFQQLHQGLPVFGGELIVQLEGNGRGAVAGLGKWSPGLQLDTAPAVPASAAAQTAIREASGWHAVPEAGLRATAPELWIYDSTLVGPWTGPPRLVWRVEVSTLEPAPIHELVLVDAQFGNVALHFNQIAHALDRRTYSANNSASLSDLWSTLVCHEAMVCASGDVDAALAHEFAGDTYNFFHSLFGRDSIDGAGLPITSTVHYGTLYANAYWDTLRKQMVYGDRFGFAHADDVVAHELMHGITQHESGLFYYYQSGAINEALSDIFGEFVDLWNGKGTDGPEVRWLLGEDIAGLGAIRSLKDPTLFGHPDRMTSPHYYTSSGDRSNPAHDHGGVHRNSGVANKAAYLLTDGDLFNGVQVTGLGLIKTAHIFYEAATNLLTSGADYADLANALYQACLTLDGLHTNAASDCPQVLNAIQAVEMDQQPLAGANPEASPCPSDQSVATTLFFDGFEAGTANWALGANLHTNRWVRTTGYARTGTYALYASDNPAVASDSFARMAASVLVPPNAYLHFAHAFGFEEPDKDGGVLEYSTNNGATWHDAGHMFAAGGNGYNGMLSSGPLAGRPAFVSDSHGYISSRVILDSLAGQNVRFRWRLSTDDAGRDLGWLIDDVSLHTCTGPAEQIYRLYFPWVGRDVQPGAPGWQTIASLDFEDGIPDTWSVFDNNAADGAEYHWASRDCAGFESARSGWAVGGGAQGGGLACGASYPDDASAWMVYGPFSLEDAGGAEMALRSWRNLHGPGDRLCLMASVNGASFAGFCYSSSTAGSWQTTGLDLDTTSLGTLSGQPQVWVAVIFQSDASGSVPVGAYVDDIVVRKCQPAGCAAGGVSRTAAGSPGAAPEQPDGLPATLIRPAE